MSEFFLEADQLAREVETLCGMPLKLRSVTRASQRRRRPRRFWLSFVLTTSAHAVQEAVSGLIPG